MLTPEKETGIRTYLAKDLILDPTDKEIIEDLLGELDRVRDKNEQMTRSVYHSYLDISSNKSVGDLINETDHFREKLALAVATLSDILKELGIELSHGDRRFIEGRLATIRADKLRGEGE